MTMKIGILTGALVLGLGICSARAGSPRAKPARDRKEHTRAKAKHVRARVEAPAGQPNQAVGGSSMEARAEWVRATATAEAREAEVGALDSAIEQARQAFMISRDPRLVSQVKALFSQRELAVKAYQAAYAVQQEAMAKVLKQDRAEWAAAQDAVRDQDIKYSAAVHAHADAVAKAQPIAIDGRTNLPVHVAADGNLRNADGTIANGGGFWPTDAGPNQNQMTAAAPGGAQIAYTQVTGILPQAGVGTIDAGGNRVVTGMINGQRVSMVISPAGQVDVSGPGAQVAPQAAATFAQAGYNLNPDKVSALTSAAGPAPRPDSASPDGIWHGTPQTPAASPSADSALGSQTAQ